MLRALSGPGQSARRVGVAVLLLMPLASFLLPVLAQRRAPDPDGIAGARPVFTSLVGTVTAIGQSGPTDAGRRTGAYLRLDTGAKTLTLWMGPHVPENLWDNITEGDRIAARAVRNRSRNDYGAVRVSVGDSTYSLHNFVPNGPCASNRRSGSLGRPPPCDSMLGGRVGPHRGLGRSRSGHHRSAPPWSGPHWSGHSSVHHGPPRRGSSVRYRHHRRHYHGHGARSRRPVRPPRPNAPRSPNDVPDERGPLDEP